MKLTLSIYTFMRALLLFVITFVLISTSHAQSVVIEYDNNQELEISLSEIAKITFGSDSIYLHVSSGQVTTLSADNTLFNYNKLTSLTGRFNDEFELKVYPNPTQTHVFIELPKLVENITVELFNTTGQLLYEEKITDATSELKIPVHELDRGVYFCVVSSGELSNTAVFIKD